MNHLFEILNIDDSTIIVIGKTYYGIDDYISELETELAKRQFRGEIIFDLLFSAISNELKNKDNNFWKRYINGYNIIHTKEIKNQINIMLERKIMTKVDYKILKSYFYIIFVIFIRKKYRGIF